MKTSDKIKKTFAGFSGKQKTIYGVLALCAVTLLIIAIVLIVSMSGRVSTEAVKAPEVSELSGKVRADAGIEPIMKYTQYSASDISVKTLLVADGDTVEKGSVVAYLESDYTELYISLLEQKLQAEASMLAQSDAASEEIYKSISAQIDALLSNVSACNEMFVTADISGKIRRIRIDSGSSIAVGDAMFEIIDDTVYIASFAIGDWTPSIEYGTSVKLYNSDGKPLEFTGKVAKLVGESGVKRYTLKIEGDCDAYYDDFSTAIVNLDFGNSVGAVIPSCAIVAENGTDYVYIIKGGRARKTEVTVGTRTADSVCVTSGILPGQVVSTQPMRLTDGVKAKALTK